MRERRAIPADDPIVAATVQALATELGSALNGLAAVHARALLRSEIADRDLIPRQSVGCDQPTASELLRAIASALEGHARRPKATATGAHRIVLCLAREMGVYGADRLPHLTRTRAQVEADRDARWLDAQTGTECLVATRSAAEGRQR